MEGRELILHFEGAVGFLTPNRKISLVDLGLSGMLSKFKNPAYWVLRVVRASPLTGRIFVDVISYHSGYLAVSDAQLRNTDLLQYRNIDFKSLDTKCVYASNRATGPNSFVPKPEQPVNRAVDETVVPIVHKPTEPIQYSFTELFAVDWQYANFLNGEVAFQVNSKVINKTFTLSVFNIYILPEYEYIKSWFPLRLGKQQFTVSASIEIKEHSIVSYKCASPEIAQITPELITAIQLQRIIHLSSTPKVQAEKSLFTLDEAFKEVNVGDKAGNIFQHPDADVLNQLLGQSNIRNKRELQYLSGKLHSMKQPLRFTLNPQFGFLFCVEGILAIHFIWELLNSNATYIWTIERNKLSASSQFQLVDRQISIILKSGRQEYRASYQTTISPSIAFKAIHHKSKESGSGDSFTRWKDELEKYLA